MHTPPSSHVLSGRTACCVALFALAWLLPLFANAQTLTIDNEIQTYAALTNTTITVTGRAELRITGTSSPISGSTINLTSPDAWLFLTNIKPSVVSSTYLSQIRVNGAAAVLNTNCRIVQYANGTAVIPHSSTFAPLQVFTGKYFTGSSMALTNYTAYNDTSLGALANNISSFKLKRGYTATIAQNANGTGVSRNYVAQDGDIEVAVLPDELDNSVSFVRVFPWRWVTKKGSCDVDPVALNATWHYNWNISKNSALDWEYVAIKQQPFWPGLNQNWQTRQVNHLLGFNEPNNSVEDAYKNLTPPGSVSDAVARWPELLGTGLRVGAPAVTDGGYSWIVDFVNQADAAGYRVDYVPVHYYRSYSNNDNPQGAATSLYNFLKSIYDVVKRPIWVTEFNNGANWTDNAYDPNVTQNRNVIEAMVQMMDNTPWIERYAIYSNVEWFRDTHYDDGSLTPMGAMYRDHVAPMAYQQVVPEVPTPAGALYRFENDARDSSANGHAAITRGAATFTAGKTGRAVVMSGDAASADHVQLSPRIGDSTDFTFGAWVYWAGGSNWQRIFDLGSGTNNYMFLTPSSGNGTLRFAIKNGGSEQQLNHTAALPTNTWTHVAVTISGNTGKLFVNGALVATNTNMTINPGDIGTTSNFLGKSQFSADPYFAGRLDEVQFLPYALGDAKVAALMTNTPPVFTSSTISGGNATQGIAYTGSLAGAATDPDAGDTLIFSKIDGPAWLTVAANGALSGTPTSDYEGPQEFTVSVTDGAGASAIAVLTITLPVIDGNGTWSSTSAGGSWGDATKWLNNFPANGSGNTANFGTLDIAADLTVTLNRSRAIGSLIFGDTSGTQSWTLNNTVGATLTLDAASPTITVNQNTATIAVPLAGTSGVTKGGAGTLVLSGANSLSGTLNVDTSSSSGSGGIVRLANPAAVSDITAINIRNNNSGTSTLELDGLHGPVLASAPISLSGRSSTTVPAIRNVFGTNRLAGTISINVGGGEYRIESAAGTLQLGALRSAAGGTRNITLQGSGNGLVSGSIENGSAATVNIVKSGAGRWTLDAANAYTGTTTVSQGELVVNGATGSGDTTVASGATLGGGGTVRANLTAQTGSKVRVGDVGFPLVPDTRFSLIDDFETYPTGNIGATPNTTGNVWTGVFDGTANAGIIDDGGNRALSVYGINSGGQPWRGAITALKNPLPHGQTGTYFFRVRRTGTATTDLIFGFSDQAVSTASAPGNDTADPWNEYAITLSVFGDSTNSSLRAYSEGSGDVNVSSVTTNEWLNVWVIVNNAAKTFQVATSSGLANGTLAGTTFNFGRRTGATAGANPLVTFGIHERLNVAGQIDDLYFASGSDLSNPLNTPNLPLVPKAGTLNVANNFTLSTGATLEFDVSSGALYDRLVVGGQLSATGTLRVMLDPQSPAPKSGDSFDLFDAGTIALNSATLDLPALAPGLSWDTSAINTGVLSVTGVASGYTVWAQGHAFPPGTDGLFFDADFDGIPNAFEWLFGTDPVTANAGALPQGMLREVNGTEFAGADPSKQYLSITATVRKSIPGMTLVAQAASSPALLDEPGASGNIVSILVSDLGEFEKREWIYTVPLQDSNRGFMRLKLMEQ